MKHLLRLLIAGIVLVIGIFPAKAVTYYHDDYTIGDLSYRLYYFYTANVPQYDDHVYVVSAAPDVKLKGDVVIPESVDILDMSLRVNGFLDHAFSGEDEMTSITFPKYDGEDAGWIGSSSYGSGVFQNCSSLKHIEIPAAVQYVSDWFKGCTSLEEVTILGVDESAVTTIETLHIAYDTFADCPIKSFSFNRSIAISDFEEDRCILPDLNIENITIGEKVTYIPSGLFTGRTDILAYTVPDNIEYINEAAFKDCTNLAEINLGKVKEIRKNAFNNCPLSETLTIPGSVLSLDRCFQNCSGVRRLIMEPHEGERKETIKNNGEIFIDTPIESAYIDREFETPNAQFVTFPLLKSVEFGPNVTTLPSRLISSSPIEEIIFGENMKSFDEYSVPICLTKLVIPAQVEEIKMNAISTLTELTELIFEDGENPLHISYRKPSTIAYPMFETAGKLRKIYIGRDIMYDRYVSAATPDLVSSQQLYSPFRDLGHPVWVMVGPGVNHMDPDMFYDKKYTASTSVDRIAMPEGITLNGGYPYMKCVYPRDAVIKEGIIFDSYHTKLYWVDIDYEGEIELPETILEIGSVAMRSCVKASIDRIPENLEKIGDYAFDISGVSFENIVFPESMREIGIAAFASCKIDSVTINSGLEKIGQGALTHPNTVIYNARHAVLERNGNDKDAVFLPKSITFGEEVESIPAFLLYNAGVKEIALPQGLKEIGEYAFFNASLTALTIPGSVQNIGAGAFEDCVYLKNIVIEKGSAPLCVENGPVFGKRVKPLRVSIERDVLDKYESPVQVYSNAPTTLYVGPDVKSLYLYNNLRPYKAIWNTAVLPSGANNYNLGLVANYTRTDNLLYNAPGIVTLKYLASMFDNGGIYYVLTSTSEAVAIDCSYRAEDKIVEIPSQVESPRGDVQVSGMLPYTFTGNTILEEITLGFDGSIEQNAFQGCTALRNFNATGNLTSVGVNAFNGCNALEEINFFGAVEKLEASSLAYLPKLRLAHFEDLDKIGPDAFSGDSALEWLELPETVTSIGSSAFYNCSSLERISLPESLEEIGSSAFYGCSSLKEIDLESNIAILPDHAFNGCTALEEIKIPEHIKDIKTSAFTGCTAIKEVTIHPRSESLQFNSHENGRTLFTDSPVETINLGGDVTYPAGHSPFSNLSSLRTVMVDHNVSALPDDIFSGCSNIDNVNLGDGIKTIGDRAFQGCSRLRELKIGPAVAKIGANAFDGANGMETLTSEAEEPPVCDTDALEGIDKFNCELHVPVPSVDKYKQAPQWEDFFTIKGEDIATEIKEIDNLSESIICVSEGIRAIGLDGKIITVTSLDGKTVTRHAVTINNQFIALPNGYWIITYDGNSQRIFIK